MKIKLPVRVEYRPYNGGWNLLNADGDNLLFDEEAGFRAVARALNRAPLTKAERAVVAAADDWSKQDRTCWTNPAAKRLAKALARWRAKAKKGGRR